jgi:hypothetical protein
MKTNRGLGLSLLLSLLLSVCEMPAAAAQELFPAGVGADSDGPGFDDNVSDVPVDGGLTLLLAAGAALGARRVRRKHNKKE